ncbi:MAG TPA: RNA polymerase sigma factor [Xanthomonadales bacterium]|nr:RNA polymerase sigma factor [Xanthomonadales bacterium]
MPIYLDDKQLVKRLLRGDERAFDQFFNQNFSRLYRFAQARMSDDREATREIVLATLSKALNKIDSYLGEAALFTWLCVICRNEIVDWARRNATYHEHIVLTEDHPDLQAVVDSLAAPAVDDPRRQYQQQEASRLVQVALDSLPPQYGDALEWKYIEGYSVKEIAGRMALTPDAVQSLLARARKAFEEIYTTLTKPVLHPSAAD